MLKTLEFIREAFPESVWEEEFATGTISHIAELLEWDNEEFSAPYLEFRERRLANWDLRTAELLRSLKFEKTEKISLGDEQGKILYFAKNEDMAFLFVVSKGEQLFIQEDDCTLYFVCDSTAEDYYEILKQR